MTSQELLAAVDGLRSDLERLDASQKELYETCGRVLEMLRNIVSPRPGQAQILATTPEVAEMQKSFNQQYLQLQMQMQRESRSYTAISNIMKTKHDTVKNSISNVR